MNKVWLALVLVFVWHGMVRAELPEKLKYPKSASLGSVSGSGSDCDVLVTADPLDAVVKYYEKQTGARIGGFETEGEVKDGMARGFLSVEDSKQGWDGKDYPARDVKLHTLTQLTKTEIIVLVISRTKTDKETHIVVTRVPR